LACQLSFVVSAATNTVKCLNLSLLPRGIPPSAARFPYLKRQYEVAAVHLKPDSLRSICDQERHLPPPLFAATGIYAIRRA